MFVIGFLKSRSQRNREKQPVHPINGHCYEVCDFATVQVILHGYMIQMLKLDYAITEMS